MEVEKETAAKQSGKVCPTHNLNSAAAALKDAKERLSHDRFELLERTLRLRRRIGKIISPDVAELVREMREQGV